MCILIICWESILMGCRFFCEHVQRLVQKIEQTNVCDSNDYQSGIITWILNVVPFVILKIAQIFKHFFIWFLVSVNVCTTKLSFWTYLFDNQIRTELYKLIELHLHIFSPPLQYNFFFLFMIKFYYLMTKS